MIRPRSIEASATGAHLEVEWEDGACARIDAAALWAGCRSAVAVRRRIDGRRLEAPAGLVITRLSPIGSYGVNIAFSDGHDRGIFPWQLLRDIARRPVAADFVLPAS